MKKRWIRYLVLFMSMTLMSGCGFQKAKGIDFSKLPKPNQEKENRINMDGGFYAMGTGEYDSKDTAVVVSVSEEEQTITLLNHIVNRNYTLHYDGVTNIRDKFGEAMVAGQLVPGDIVDVKFQKSSRRCVTIDISNDAWESEVLNGFSMNQARMQLTFNDTLYSLAERMVITSRGEPIELEDLNEGDVLSVKGIENTIYSILVEKGHGYLRLTGEEYFVGGFIEIGQSIVRRITEDMLLTVPEGEYRIVVRNGVHGGSKEAAIFRDEETLLDVEDLKGEEIKTGKVFFTLTPPDANVYIDGNKIDTSTYVEMEYGIHQMIVRAAGYETISQYVKIGQENVNLNVEMEPGDGEPKKTGEKEKIMGEMPEAEDGEVSFPSEVKIPEDNTQTNYEEYDRLPLEGQENKVVGTQQAPDEEVRTGSSTYYVKINSPAQTEVYVDGNYIGLAPVSFPKKEGSHVVSLRKNGYQTRSYTIQIDNSQKDVEYSFSELAEKKDTSTLGDMQWTNDIISQTLLK